MKKKRFLPKCIACLFLLIGCSDEQEGAKTLDTANLPKLSTLEGEYFSNFHGCEDIFTIFNLTSFEANLADAWELRIPDELLLREILAYSPKRIEIEPTDSYSSIYFSKSSSREFIDDKLKIFNSALRIAGLAKVKLSDIIFYEYYSISIKKGIIEKAPLDYSIYVFELKDRGVYYLISKVPIYELELEERNAEINERLQKEVRNYYYFKDEVTNFSY